MKNIALVGVGPHAKRIYLEYLKKYKINLALVVELESKKEDIRNYLDENKFTNTKLFTIDDKFKDDKHLPSDISNNLLNILKMEGITHLIISTEPKAHYMYIEFCLKNNFHVLTDKPITVTKNMTSLKQIEEVRKQYYELLDMSKKSKGSCHVMCQRKYHKGYLKVIEILSKVVSKYNMPITDIDIFYSDGAWEMPHDMDKENHPYKYGYGELFHSGYHFISLLSDFIKINDSLAFSKKIVRGEVYSKVYTPNDEMNAFGVLDYRRLFKGEDIPSYYYDNSYPKFDRYGEKNYHGLLSFYNRNGLTITTASLNLLHNGVSRRAWMKTREFYKSNGRIRHERVNIEVGHLLNIQIHSYQSKEIKDRLVDEEKVGGLEHFDIYVFSNPIVDKVPFKEYHLGDMYKDKEKVNFQGYNELAREKFISDFLSNKDSQGDIINQALAIEILYSCSKELYNYYKRKTKVERIDVRNLYTYPFLSKRLSNYSNNDYINYDRESVEGNVFYKDIYTLYTFMDFIPSLKKYVIFVSVDDTKDVASGLALKSFNKKISAYLYYKFLNYIMKFKSISFIFGCLERK